MAAVMLLLAMSGSEAPLLRRQIQLDAYVAEAAQRFGIPRSWIRGVLNIESGRLAAGKDRIRSPKGAMGPMQIMPGTWGMLSGYYGFGADPDDPRANILAGTAYLRMLNDRFGYPGLFAAYNAGPGRYQRWLEGRASLPMETVRYQVRMASAGTGHAAIRDREGPSSIFFAVVEPDVEEALGARQDAGTVQSSPFPSVGTRAGLPKTAEHSIATAVHTDSALFIIRPER